jgi:hypothetical protein
MTCWYLAGAAAVPHGPGAAAAGDAAITPAGVPIAASTAATVRSSLLRTSTSRQMSFRLAGKAARGTPPYPSESTNGFLAMVVSMSERPVLPPGQYVASLARKRMAASAFLRDAAGRVLLVDPVYKKPWDLPGGAVEAEESPHAACRRPEVHSLCIMYICR